MCYKDSNGDFVEAYNIQQARITIHNSGALEMSVRSHDKLNPIYITSIKTDDIQELLQGIATWVGKAQPNFVKRLGNVPS